MSNKNMNRRTFLYKPIAFVSDAIFVGLFAANILYGLDYILKKRNELSLEEIEGIYNGGFSVEELKGDQGKGISVEELEKLALETHKGLDIGYYDPTMEKTDLWIYELFFAEVTGFNFKYSSCLELMKKRFNPSGPLLVADIGGSEGSAAKSLGNIQGVEAFVIDPENLIPKPGESLPKNRFIIKKIEDTGLPDGIFHFMTSQNTYQFTELPLSFTEVHRLLRKGGVAFIQYQNWYKPNILSKLGSLEIKDDVRVIMRNVEEIEYGKKPHILTLDQFVSGIRTAADEWGPGGYDKMGFCAQSYFLIAKIH